MVAASVIAGSTVGCTRVVLGVSEVHARGVLTAFRVDDCLGSGVTVVDASVVQTATASVNDAALGAPIVGASMVRVVPVVGDRVVPEVSVAGASVVLEVSRRADSVGRGVAEADTREVIYVPVAEQRVGSIHVQCECMTFFSICSASA